MRRYIPFITFLILFNSLLEARTSKSPASFVIVNFDKGKICAIEDSLHLLTHSFPAGSVIKIFSGLAFLLDGGDENRVLLCPQSQPGSPIPPTCWYRPGHGYLSLKGAIANSCDTYFSKIFSMRRYVRLLNLLESYRLISNDDYQKLASLSIQAKRKAWVGIGKNLRVRPIDLFFAIYAIVSDGNIYRKADSTIILFLRKKNIKKFSRIIKDGMREGSLTGTTSIAQEKLGTKKIFCKTGTATYFYEKEDYKKNHGYFIGFYPYPEPQFGILVFLLNGNGKQAAELGGDLLKKFFDSK